MNYRCGLLKVFQHDLLNCWYGVIFPGLNGMNIYKDIYYSGIPQTLGGFCLPTPNSGNVNCDKPFSLFIKSISMIRYPFSCSQSTLHTHTLPVDRAKLLPHSIAINAKLLLSNCKTKIVKRLIKAVEKCGLGKVFLIYIKGPHCGYKRLQLKWKNIWHPNDRNVGTCCLWMSSCRSLNVIR